MWTQEMFGVEKPIIALLHLDALPGDPGYCGSMDTVLEHARQDLVALQNGGVDGILFANEFSLPYQPVADVAVKGTSCRLAFMMSKPVMPIVVTVSMGAFSSTRKVNRRMQQSEPVQFSP